MTRKPIVISTSVNKEDVWVSPLAHTSLPHLLSTLMVSGNANREGEGRQVGLQFPLLPPFLPPLPLSPPTQHHLPAAVLDQ